MATTKILTGKKLGALWEKYRVPTFNQCNRWMLSTTGTRKLILACFPLENTDAWIEKARGYNGKPDYPFHLQPPGIQDMIVAMLGANPRGKHFIDQFGEKFLRAMLRDAVREGNHE